MKIERKDPDPVPRPPSTFSLCDLTQQEMEYLLEIAKVPKFPNDSGTVNNGVEISRESVGFAIVVEKRIEKALRDARFFEVNEEY